MPPLPPVSNVIKVNQKFTLDLNTTAECIFHFKYTGGPPLAADCVAIAGAIQAQSASNFKSLMTTEKVVGLCTVLDLNSNTGAEGVGGTPTTGTRAGSSVPASAAVVMNHDIARRYRGGHPRSYAPFLANGDMATTGTWLPTPLTACSTGWANWVAGCLTIASGGVTLTQYGSVSYYSGRVLRATPAWDPILITVPRTRLGTQRRRLKTA